MTEPNRDRSRRLRGVLTNVGRVDAEVQSAFLKAEDSLTVLEDREQRRAARNVHDDPRQRIGGI